MKREVVSPQPDRVRWRVPNTVSRQKRAPQQSRVFSNYVPATEKLSPAPPQAVQHQGYLDGLRAVAALYVVLYHCFLQVVVDMTPETFRLFQGLLFGRYAVDVFIVLSGFCLMLPVVKHEGKLRGGALNFFKRRARRILPPYYCAMLFSLALIWTLIDHKTGTGWDNSLPVTLKSIISHLYSGA